jgi:trehalose 6-phosphate phosphatase
VSTALTLEQALEPLRADPRRSAILLDVDGTLAPIVRHADDAHMPEPTRAVLIRVSRAYGLVACVSGRNATTARRIVSIGSISYVGNHGGELLRAGSSTPEIPPAFARGGEQVRAFAQPVFGDGRLRRLRVRTEDKGAIAAFHWRGAPDEDAAQAAVRELAARAQDAGLAVHWGRKVLEVRPAVQVDKGAGISWLLEGADVDTAVYVGDDTTDLDAFRGLRTLVAQGRLEHAVCVGVRSDETPPELEREADLLVDGPPGVRSVLEALL